MLEFCISIFALFGYILFQGEDTLSNLGFLFLKTSYSKRQELPSRESKIVSDDVESFSEGNKCKRKVNRNSQK